MDSSNVYILLLMLALLPAEITMQLHYVIQTTWDGRSIDHKPVHITLSGEKDGVLMHVSAPFFNDPENPGGAVGEPFEKLWDYEVVEAFFLNEREQYVEIEISPWGQHLVLFLNGRRNAVRDKLPLNYPVELHRNDDHWEGSAKIPYSYFPPNVVKFNAYAIHGHGVNRTYESLYPAAPGQYKDPDFHNLSLFEDIDMKLISADYDWSTLSREWESALQ